MLKILFCNGNKCRMKHNCLRYTTKAPTKEVISDFHTFCNKKNDYKWIYLNEKKCKNKQLQKICEKRKQEGVYVK